MTVISTLSYLLIQIDTTGHWNRTDAPSLHGKSLREQLCKNIFGSYKILIAPFFFCNFEQSAFLIPLHVLQEPAMRQS